MPVGGGKDAAYNLDSDAGRSARWQAVRAAHHLSLTSRDGSASLMLTDYPAFEGEYGYSERLHVYMSVGGSGRLQRRSEAQNLDAVLRDGSVGFSVPETAGTGFWERLRLLVLSADLSKLAVDDASPPNPEAFVPMASRLHDDPVLTAVLIAMWREAEAHGLLSAFFEHGLLIVANRILAAQPVELTRVRPLAGVRLARVIGRMRDRLADDLSVAELAGIAGMSRHHFSRAFKVATGLPPYEYLSTLRIERARELLKDQNLPIIEIALMTGFANPSQFAAAFRRITGHTPSDWRRRN